MWTATACGLPWRAKIGRSHADAKVSPMFEKRALRLPLIDYAPIYAALDRPPSGVWRVDAVDRKPQTGSERQTFFVAAGQAAAVLEYSGPSVTSLTEEQLRDELERLQRLQEATAKALSEVAAHLKFRRGLTR